MFLLIAVDIAQVISKASFLVLPFAGPYRRLLMRKEAALVEAPLRKPISWSCLMLTLLR